MNQSTLGLVTDTLTTREGQYGKFSDNARVAQEVSEVLRSGASWHSRLSYTQREALEMIAHKMARIVNGDPDYADSWHDIAGYATLVERSLTTPK